MGEYGVPGDPAGMRKLASALRRDAQQLQDGRRKVISAFSKHDSSGPIINSYKRRLGPATDRLKPLAERLLHLASELESAANQVERDVAAARLAFQRAQQQQGRR